MHVSYRVTVSHVYFRDLSQDGGSSDKRAEWPSRVANYLCPVCSFTVDPRQTGVHAPRWRPVYVLNVQRRCCRDVMAPTEPNLEGASDPKPTLGDDRKGAPLTTMFTRA